MQFALDTHYTPEEQEFIRRYHCQVLREITLRRVAFGEEVIPRRMLVYCGTTLGEIFDEGNGAGRSWGRTARDSGPGPPASTPTFPPWRRDCDPIPTK